WPVRRPERAGPWSSRRREAAGRWAPRSRLRTGRGRNERPTPAAALPGRAREVECRGFRSIEVDAQQTCGSLPGARLHLLEDLAVRGGTVRGVLPGWGRAGDRRRQRGHAVEGDTGEPVGNEAAGE